MANDTPIEERYEKAIRDAASLNPALPYQAKLQMAELIEEACRSKENIQTFLSHNTKAAQRGGFLAEEFHATTFNADSILKKASLRAETGLDNHLIGNNDKVSDVVIARNGVVEVKAQSKYLADAGSTANQHSSVDTATIQPKYEGADVALSPSNQVDDIRRHALARASAHDKAAARLIQEGGDPLTIQGHQAKAAACRQTAEKASSTLSHDGVSSAPLSKAEADTLGSGDLSKLETIQSRYKTRSTLQQIESAAAGAAAMAAVVSGTINTVRYLDLVRRGKMSTADATLKIVAETSASAIDSAIKAGLTAGAHSTLARLSNQAVAVTLARQGLGAMMRTNAVSAGVVCAVEAVKDLVLLAKGDLSKEAFYERQGKGILGTSAGTMGASLGFAAMPAAGASVALLPLAGALAGGIVASVAMNFAIEAGIEAPYRELVGNTQALRNSARLLDEVSQAVLEGQVRFAAFLDADARLDEAAQSVLADGARATAAMTGAIDRI